MVGLVGAFNTRDDDTRDNNTRMTTALRGIAAFKGLALQDLLRE